VREALANGKVEAGFIRLAATAQQDFVMTINSASDPRGAMSRRADCVT